MAALRKNHDPGQHASGTGRKSKLTPESALRGQLLERWLAENDFDQAEFARDAGISKMTMSLYVRGELDIASMHQRTVEKLLTTMHVSDTWAWAYFQIPQNRRAYWRTFREPPMGHGDEVPQGTVVSRVLDAPLSGEGYTAPAGAVVTYDTGNKLHGLLLTRLPGRYVVAMMDALPQQGEVLGAFLSSSPAAPATAR